MTNYKMQVEAKGKDLEAAIASGLAELQTTRNDVIVEILDEGRSGLLGIGSRDAVVKLTRMSPPPQPKQQPKPKPQTSTKPAPKQPASPPPPKRQPQTKAKETVKPEPKKRPSKNKPQRPTQQKSTKKEPSAPAKPAQESTIAPKKRPAPATPPAERPAPPIDLEGENADLNLQGEIATKMIQELLDKMQVQATVSTELEEPDDMGKQMVVVNLEGDELNALVGVRGDTLNALQSVSRLMVGHQIRQRTDFVIDVNGYRQQRRQALTRMAERMAGKAASRGRPLNLEPMPPYERRIIHMALRQREDVYTQSVGEGRRRKVRIIPTSDETAPTE